LITGNQRISYEDLDASSNRVANALIATGVMPGDRIAMLARDSVAAVIMLFGVAKAKAVLININWRLTADEIACILCDGAPCLLLVDEEFAFLVPQLTARIALRMEIAGLAEWGKDAAESAPGLS